MNFKAFIEALKFDDPRTSLQNHPLAQNATFGLEIEFAAISPPEDEVRELDIYAALKNNKQFIDAVKAELHDPSKESDDDDDDPDEKQMIYYINNNKRECFRMIYDIVEAGEFDPGMNDNQYQSLMLDHYFYYISQDITKYGFKILKGQTAAEGVWAMGVDGYEPTYNVPLLEIRTAILTRKDIPQLSKVLHELAKSFKAYQKEILITGNTGIHVHVGNQKTNDSFTRLAIASQADEDAIWNAELHNNRDFERHARLNKQQDFSSWNDEGSHSQIAYHLAALTTYQNPRIIAAKDFDEWVRKTLSRNAGINPVSRQPTIEYRHLSTGTLVKNPQQIINFINYYIDHAAQMSNKDQISFQSKDEKTKFILTKLPNQNIRIQKIDNKTLKKNLPRSNEPMKSLDKQPTSRQIPIKKWWQELKPEERDKIRDDLDKKGYKSYYNQIRKDLANLGL
jgi:hypothetical protein